MLWNLAENKKSLYDRQDFIGLSYFEFGAEEIPELIWLYFPVVLTNTTLVTLLCLDL